MTVDNDWVESIFNLRDSSRSNHLCKDRFLDGRSTTLAWSFMIHALPLGSIVPVLIGGVIKDNINERRWRSNGDLVQIQCLHRHTWAKTAMGPPWEGTDVMTTKAWQWVCGLLVIACELRAGQCWLMLPALSEVNMKNRTDYRRSCYEYKTPLLHYVYCVLLSIMDNE